MRVVLGALIGGVVGLGVSLFGICLAGSCPLTKDPITSFLVFAAVGTGIAALLSREK